MKTIILLGSRDRRGRTARAAEALRDGLNEKGAEVDMVFLTDRKLERCRQCEDSGWGACIKEGKCCINDDFAGIADQIRSADLAVFANPVYYSDLSESMRAFLDRLRRTCHHDNGKEGIKGKRVFGLCVAGGGGGGSYQCATRMEWALSTCGFDIIDLVPARRQNLDLKLNVLKETGRWLASCS